jgi:hypothetical protein
VLVSLDKRLERHELRFIMCIDDMLFLWSASCCLLQLPRLLYGTRNLETYDVAALGKSPRNPQVVRSGLVSIPDTVER